MLLTMILGLLVATAVPAAQAPFEQNTAVWELKHTTVIDPGDTVVVPADPGTDFPGGVLTTGYTLKAKAKSKNGELVPEGEFLLTLSAFLPNADMPSQKAGLWHVQGQWTIVNKNADSKALKARHNPFTVAGRIHAALPFNPAKQQMRWSAGVTVPMVPAAGQWARGKEGSLTLDANRQGELYLLLELSPANQ
jgi:hypothetical protein